MNAKSLRGWICLAVFVLACCFIGYNRYLMKAQNVTLIAMMAISVCLVLLLNGGKTGGKEAPPELEKDT